MKTTLMYSWRGDASTLEAGDDLTALMHQINRLEPTAPNAFYAFVPPQHESPHDFIVVVTASQLAKMLYRIELVERRCSQLSLRAVQLAAEHFEAEEYSNTLSGLALKYPTIDLDFELKRPICQAAAKCG